MQSQNYCRSVASGSTSPSTRNQQQQQGKNGRSRQQQNYRKAHSVSPPQQSCFASSQFCNSPSARSIPLPPSQWINKMTSKSPSSPSSSSPNSSGTTSPSSSIGFNENITGVRVCPLQLIAAVASS